VAARTSPPCRCKSLPVQKTDETKNCWSKSCRAQKPTKTKTCQYKPYRCKGLRLPKISLAHRLEKGDFPTVSALKHEKCKIFSRSYMRHCQYLNFQGKQMNAEKVVQ
ncbi:MAG: hypothetical protein K2N86_03505, partial [Rikenellaceae bacterium]|nr:hypothetical protein [Rikenellaceae bacterium]